MTPTLIAIIVLCVLVVLFAPVLWSFAAPLGHALWRRYVVFEWPTLLSTLADDETVPDYEQNGGNRRSDAVERDREQAGTGNGNSVPTVAELLSDLTDDDVLRELANAKTPDGDDRWTDSRIAKFIGGRIEDRVAQVRAVREKHAPAPQAQGRAIPVSHRGRDEHVMLLDDTC